MGKVMNNNTKPYEELSLQERKEYWASYIDGLAQYMHTPFLEDRIKTAIYREIQKIYLIIQSLDQPGASIPKRTIESKLNTSKVKAIAKKGMEASKKPKRTYVKKKRIFKYKYDGAANKFNLIDL